MGGYLPKFAPGWDALLQHLKFFLLFQSFFCSVSSEMSSFSPQTFRKLSNLIVTFTFEIRHQSFILFFEVVSFLLEAFCCIRYILFTELYSKCPFLLHIINNPYKSKRSHIERNVLKFNIERNVLKFKGREK